MLKDLGINIKKNDFLNQGIVIYEDSYGNSVFMKREFGDNKEGFVAKLRPADKNVKAESIHVSVPVADDEMGTNLQLHFLDGQQHNGEDMSSAIRMFTEVMQRWINIMYDIRFMQTDNKMLLRANQNLSEEDVCRYKLMQLGEYEELQSLNNLI